MVAARAGEDSARVNWEYVCEPLELLGKQGGELGREAVPRLQKLWSLWRLHGAAANLVGPSVLVDPEHGREGVAGAALAAKRCGISGSWVDIGAGGGLPGLIVACVLPGWTVELVEPRERRVAFLELATGALNLRTNVCRGRLQENGYSGRPGEPTPQGAPDVVSARAVWDPPTWLGLARKAYGAPTRAMVHGRAGEGADAYEGKGWAVSLVPL